MSEHAVDEYYSNKSALVVITLYTPTLRRAHAAHTSVLVYVQGTSPAEWEDHAQEGGVAGRLQTQRKKEEFFIDLQISTLRLQAK